MKVTDCAWELENLHVKTIEVLVDKDDVFRKEDFMSFDSCGYQVVKVPVNKVDFNFGLSSLGFSFIEGQLRLGKQFDNFDVSRRELQVFAKQASYDLVDSEEKFNSVIGRVTPEMFVTDRVALDPHFGKEAGCRRYSNWMRTEYKNGTSKFMRVFFRNLLVGFVMYRDKGELMDSLLGGAFSDVRIPGIGLLTIAAPFYYFPSKGGKFTTFETNISTNNPSVRRIYDDLGFSVINEYYVFVKHCE